MVKNHVTCKTNDHRYLCKNAVVRARVNAYLKNDVENLLENLGLTMSEAISLYLAQIKLTGGIPFEVKMPNETTLETFKDTDRHKKVVKAKSIREIFERAGL